MSDKIIFPDSPEAAQYATGLAGWVSRHGRYHGDGQDSEKYARYDGCTHIKCHDCGAPTQKGTALCDDCCDKHEAVRYAAMPKRPWDGKAMLYSQTLDRFYSDLDEAEECALECDITVPDLRLVICEPNYPRRLDEDYFCDQVREDDELPAELIAAMEAFNAAISNSTPISWSPGQFALELN